MKSKKIIWLFLALIILGCDKFEPEPEIINERQIRDVSVSEIPEIEGLLTQGLGIFRNDDPNRFTVNNGNRTLNLDIDWSKIVELIDTLGNTNYTIAVKDDTNAPYIFHNLIVGKTPEGHVKKPFLMTYEMSPEFRETYDRTGSIKSF